MKSRSHHLAELLVLAMAAACTTPSSEIDGGDLLGVFQHDAGNDAGRSVSDAGASERDGGGAAKATPPAAARTPPEGSCVAVEGERLHDMRRALGHPPCRDAQVLEWKDADDTPRYACVIAPRGAETRAPLPLVVFFHAPDERATSVEKTTGLRKLGASLNLTGAAAHAGFIVLAPQGRALNPAGQGGSFDAGYTGPDNVDVQAVDHFVDELLAKGLVDKRRIYAIGASLSGRMAGTYAMVRADRVAAFATYGSDAPPASWSCPGPPPPAFVLYRSCDDTVACAAVERWLRLREAAGADTRALRLGAGDEEEPNCAVRNKCTKKRAAGRHQVWPRGREEEVLRFLGAHTLALDQR